MSLQHFHVCAVVAMLSLLHVLATRSCYMSPQYALHKFFCPRNMSVQHYPSSLQTIKVIEGMSCVTNTVDCCDCVTVDTSFFYVTYRLVVGITFHSTHM